MSNGATERLADVASLSEAYTSALGDCVDALAATVDRYVDDRPYDDPLGRVRESETVCDVRRRELTDALATLRDADATPFARDGVPAGDLAELYHDLDEVANAAEQVAEELAAIEPTLPADCARGSARWRRSRSTRPRCSSTSSTTTSGRSTGRTGESG